MNEVRAFAPATVANVSCGFDVFGMALEAPGDEVLARRTEGSLVRIRSVSGDGGRLPLDAGRNTAGVAVRAFLDAIGSRQGVELEVYKRMPLGSGMGSSAASAVAALVAANRLLGDPLSRLELLPFAMEGERSACGSAHADNVGPALLGGFVLIRSYRPLDVVKVPVAMPLFCGLAHPHIEIRTRDARALLPDCVPMADAVGQWGNTAALVAALCTGDYGLLFRSVQDLVAEPLRKNLIPHFAEAREAALAAGCEAFGISGSGPSLFMLSRDRAAAAAGAAAVAALYAKLGVGCDHWDSRVNLEGARVLAAEGGPAGSSSAGSECVLEGGERP